MSDIKWYLGTTTSVMTTELNSIATAAAAITGTKVDADADLAPYGDLFLTVTYGTNPTANSTVDCYFVRSYDGTTFEDGATSGPVLPANGFVGSFVLRATTSAQVLCIHDVTLPPVDWHVILVNGSGQTTAASGNVLRLVRFRRQVV